MLTFFVDTDCDFTAEDCRKYGFRLISMPYAIDGKLIRPYEDFEVFDYRTYYDALRGGLMPTTSSVPEETYINYFRPEFKQGNDILYVHFSGGMSSTFTGMRQAVEKLLAEFPERKFYEVDTKGIAILGMAIAFQVKARLDAGDTPEEAVAYGQRELYHFATYFVSDDLKFFHRSGRVSGLSATMGSLLGIRPMIIMDSDGMMKACGKEKGRAKAIARLLSYMEEFGDHVTDYPIYIGHTDATQLVEMMRAAILEKYGPETKIIEVVTNPTAGAHCGPDSMGVCFHSLHR